MSNISFNNNSKFFHYFDENKYIEKIKNHKQFKKSNKLIIFNYFILNYKKNNIHGFKREEIFNDFKKCIYNLKYFDNETYYNNYYNEFKKLNWNINDTKKLKNHYINQGIFKKKNCIKNNKIIYINTYSNLNIQVSDVILISNMVNKYIKNGYQVELSSYYKISNIFLRNIEDIKNLHTYELNNNDNIINYLDNNNFKFEFIFFNNNEILNLIENKLWLDKCILYGLDIHLNNIKKLDKKYKEIWTQSDKLKQLYLENGISDNKIIIKEPIAYKYNFDIPERKDNEIRLIYCGTLRDEENILEIIEEFEKINKERPEVVLKIVYGKIKGNIKFIKQVKEYIKNGVKGITFKQGLNHRDACYEIATSDIGICWRKNGWRDNDEISTKVKDYKLYHLEIMNDMKIKVGVVTSTNKLNKIDNIILNFKHQLYFNKKLFLVINRNDISVNNIETRMIEHNILYEIIHVDEKFNLGHCLNEAIKKLKEEHYNIFAKFDDDDIYEKKYLLEQIYYLNKYRNCIVGKYNIPLFIPEHNNFYTIHNFTKNNQFAEICRGSTIMFNVNDIKHSFNTEKTQGVDSIFLKQHITNKGKIYVTTFDNYIWIRHLDNNKHTWKLNISHVNLKQITNTNIIYDLNSSLLKYRFVDVSHYDENQTLKYIDNYISRTYKNNLCKKIYIIIWEDKNNAKGINIDSEILYNTLNELNYNVFYLKIPLLYLKNFDSSNNNILLDGDIYIFSEVCFTDIYDFIFKNKKEIICIPNIDSYSTYKPIIKNREADFINSLKHYTKNNKFDIWCKTKQIYNWLKKEEVNNLHYTHFCYNIYINNVINVSNNIKELLKKKNNYILLDTGNSTTKRKYLEEILDVFIKNKNIPYTLLVKTTPKVYDSFLRDTKYEKKYNNIKIISEMLSVGNLTYLYKQCKFFIYCSKFDGYGLSLSQAIKYKLFIFTFDGLPWCELLESYPRKCFISCQTDFTKSMGVNVKGKALSQIYYKGNFDDLTNKLLHNKEKYENIISTTDELCNFVNFYNHNVFLSNIKYYFQTKYDLCKIYNRTSIGVISYKDREIIFIENLMNIISQAKYVVIYLNTSTDIIKNFLSNISNIHVTFCETDLKSLTKLMVINNMNKENNMIIDDDIVYPPDYVEYTYNILEKLNKKCVYSYNGYSENFKYPFTTKTKKNDNDNCNIGTGTLFYKKNAIKYGLSEYVNKKIATCDKTILLFCDKLFLKYCKNKNIRTKIITPKHSFWLKNNSKMKFGLLEEKKQKNIYDLTHANTILLHENDCLVDYKKSLPDNIKKLLINKIHVTESSNNKKYYNILFNESKLQLQNIQKETIITLKLDYYTISGLKAGINNFIKNVSCLYYLSNINVIITYQSQINDNSTEMYVINNLKKLNINCVFIKTQDLINNIDKYKNYICLYNLKNKKNLIDKLKNCNLKFYGYTWDLINYNNKDKINRQEIMIYNINHMKASFIVEDSYNYKNITNNCFHIFQPTKVKSYTITPSDCNDVKFLHFGRLNSNILQKIIKIAETFPLINIYLYGYNKNIENILLTNNIFFKESEFIEGIDMYNLTKNDNTFVLSFSEFKDQCYYSNRIPMLLGYNSLVIQEEFKNIQKYFTNSEMIIYSDIDTLKIKISNIINNYDAQNIMRKNGLICSKKYSFDNYVYEILMHINQH
tara:strand:+ start:4349 stop:9343 length:4995 start_codon:yes stop_codon:yes gene_type:complete